MHYFSQSSIFCVHPSAAAGLRQDFVNDRNGEILLCVTLPCITVRSFAERLRGWGAIAVVTGVSAKLLLITAELRRACSRPYPENRE